MAPRAGLRSPGRPRAPLLPRGLRIQLLLGFLHVAGCFGAPATGRDDGARWWKSRGSCCALRCGDDVEPTDRLVLLVLQLRPGSTELPLRLQLLGLSHHPDPAR